MNERHCKTCVCGCTCGFGGEHVEDNPRCALFGDEPGSIVASNDVCEHQNAQYLRMMSERDALRAEVERLRDRQRTVPVYHCETHLCGSCAGCKRDGVLDENTALRQQVADLRAGIIAAVTVLNREFYRRPVTWIERLAKDLRALLAGSDEQADRWEYGVRWGDEPDDSRPTLCDSREHAESRAAASHGDKIVRRAPARTIPAGPWEEMPRG